MKTIRTRLHLSLGEHMYADISYNPTVLSIITAYSAHGMPGVFQKWPDVFTTPVNNIVYDPGYQLGRWCLEHKAYDLFAAFHSLFKPFVHQKLIKHSLHSNDDCGFACIFNVRKDAAWMDAMQEAFGESSNQLWLSKMLKHTVDHTLWRTCAQKLIYTCARQHNNVAAEALLGGWCGVCQSLLCEAPGHTVKRFLDERTPTDCLAAAIQSLVHENGTTRIKHNTTTILNLVRTHESWGNTCISVQDALHNLLRMAVFYKDEPLIAMLLGPNDRVLTAHERQQQLCVNTRHITQAFTTLNKPRSNPLGQYFMGLMDDSFFEGEPWKDVLERNRQQRQYVALLKAAGDRGVATKRKM